MHQVQVKLALMKNKIDLIVPEQQVLTESLDEVTFYTFCSWFHFVVELIYNAEANFQTLDSGV